MSRLLLLTLVAALVGGAGLLALPGCQSTDRTSGKMVDAHPCPKCGAMTTNEGVCERCKTYTGAY